MHEIQNKIEHSCAPYTFPKNGKSLSFVRRIELVVNDSFSFSLRKLINIPISPLINFVRLFGAGGACIHEFFRLAFYSIWCRRKRSEEAEKCCHRVKSTRQNITNYFPWCRKRSDINYEPPSHHLKTNKLVDSLPSGFSCIKSPCSMLRFPVLRFTCAER